MIVNAAQEAAVECDEHVCLVSCPGSGKTRTVVAKVLWCLKQVRETTRRIGCITYTNAAVNEIETRLRQFGGTDDDIYYEICTIHAFCLNHIIRPYHYRLPEFATGFEVVTPDDERWKRLVKSLIEKYRLKARTAECFERIRRDVQGKVIPPKDKDFPFAAAVEFVRFFDQNAFISFEDMVYQSARLIARHPFIARCLASRFAWLLIDEFQDTSAAQVAIFRAVVDYGRTSFFLVGDPNQSIMSFAGAHPELMMQFSAYMNARTDHVLRGNYRCSSRIVTHAERLCECNPPMDAVGDNREFIAEPEYIHTTSIAQGLFDHFLPAVDQLGIPLGDAAVLAPSWFAFLPVARELRSRNVPIVGPGARPYRSSRDFAQLAEHACACLDQYTPALNYATHRALFVMLLNVTGTPDWRLYSYDGRRTVFRLLNIAKDIRRTHEGAVAWLRQAAGEFSTVLVEEGFMPSDKAHILADSAEAMVADMTKNSVDIANLSTGELGIYAQPGACLQLMTLHKSKGQEFEAVAIVDLHDNKIPHWTASTDEEIAEARRLLYVGATRAKTLLMYFTDSSNYRNRPSRFLGTNGLGLLH